MGTVSELAEKILINISMHSILKHVPNILETDHYWFCVESVNKITQNTFRAFKRAVSQLVEFNLHELLHFLTFKYLH